MTNLNLLKARLPILLSLLVCLEGVNLVKFSIAMGWTNGTALGVIAALALGLFLIGSIVALSFDLEEGVKTRLQWMVVGMFVIQTLLICIVSYLHSLSLMPASEIAQLFSTPTEGTRKFIALLEGVATNVATFAFWGVLGTQWRREVEIREGEKALEAMMQRETAQISNKARNNGRRREGMVAGGLEVDPLQEKRWEET